MNLRKSSRGTHLRAGVMGFLAAALLLAYPTRGYTQSSLPDGPGKDVFTSVCTQCHGLESVITLRLARQEWEGLVNDMISRGAPAFGNDYEVIVNYLATNFSGAAISRQNSPAETAPTATSSRPAAPGGPGRELVESFCTECHSLNNITDSKRTAERWRETVHTMIEYGAVLLDDEIEVIVNYLAANYGPGSGAAGATGAPSENRSASGGSERTSGLPDGPGKEVVASVCTQCHGLDNVTTLRLAPEEWEGLVNDMIARGAPAFGDQYKVITQYLIDHFGKGR